MSSFYCLLRLIGEGLADVLPALNDSGFIENKHGYMGGLASTSDCFPLS